MKKIGYISMTILGPEVSYCELLDHEIMEKIAKDNWTAKFPLRPSAAGYCSRRLAFDLAQFKGLVKYDKEAMEPHVWRLLNLGHSVEYSALKNLELLPGFSLRYKQQMVSIFRLDSLDDQPGTLIEGAMDVVLWNEKYRALLDVKSAKDGFSAAFKTRWDETLDKFNQMKSLVKIGDSNNGWYADDVEAFIEELNGDFLIDNLYQLNLYACSDFLRERGIDHAVVYKYCKNDSRHYEIRFKPSMALFEKTRQKFNKIQQTIHDTQDPLQVGRDSYLGSFRCAFCPYKKPCWGEADALKAWFANFPKKAWPEALDDIDDPELPELFAAYEAAGEAAESQGDIETKICDILTAREITKVRLDNGHVYEVKLYKTPRSHFELRRSKV
jgi:hypothetical protein